MWRDYRKQPLAVCVCVTFPNFTHWFSVCARSTCVFPACCCNGKQKKSLSLSSPPPLSATSFARSHACLLAAPLKRGGSVFLCSSRSLSSCLLLFNLSPVDGRTVAHLLAKTKIVHVHAHKRKRTHIRKNGKKD